MIHWFTWWNNILNMDKYIPISLLWDDWRKYKITPPVLDAFSHFKFYMFLFYWQTILLKWCANKTKLFQVQDWFKKKKRPGNNFNNHIFGLFVILWLKMLKEIGLHSRYFQVQVWPSPTVFFAGRGNRHNHKAHPHKCVTVKL